MDINIYKTYSFTFDTKKYIENFKEALRKANKNRPADFNKLLEDAGIKYYDYETVKSYFYGRRVPPMDVFIAVCKSLHLNADVIAFPDSIPDPECDINIDIWKCDGCFNNIFYPYSLPEEGKTQNDCAEFFDEESYKDDVDDLAKILSRYNYLIQKYHDAAVTNNELQQIIGFTSRYIIDRSKGVIDANEVVAWIRGCTDENFLEAFYDKYTLGFYGMSCYSLLKLLSTDVDDKFIQYAKKLLPYQDISAR